MEDNFAIIEQFLMVKMSEVIDSHKSRFIRERADQYLVRADVTSLVFDCEDTKFMDSSGVGVIMGRYKKISCFGGQVYAIHVDRQVNRILTVSGLNKIMEIIE